MNKEAYIEVGQECARMCHFYFEQARCIDCPANWRKNPEKVECTDLIMGSPKTAFDIIQKWSKENPRKASDNEGK